MERMMHTMSKPKRCLAALLPASAAIAAPAFFFFVGLVATLSAARPTQSLRILSWSSSSSSSSSTFAMQARHGCGDRGHRRGGPTWCRIYQWHGTSAFTSASAIVMKSKRSSLPLPPPPTPKSRRSTTLRFDSCSALRATVGIGVDSASWTGSRREEEDQNEHGEKKKEKEEDKDSYSRGKKRADKVLVLGGSGFLGRRIVRLLSDMGIPYVATSTSGASPNVNAEGAAQTETTPMVALDLTLPDAERKVCELAHGCTAVISTVGSIGSDRDETINGASVIAAFGSKKAGVDRFVFVGNAPRVRSLSKRLPFLRSYAKGKEQSERAIRTLFDQYCIVQPTFMYGGDDLSLDPPRVPHSLGRIAEDLLGLYPVAALAESLPGLLGVAMEAPVNVDRVAKAAVNSALGLCGDATALVGREEIVLAACKRRGPEEECLINSEAECDMELEIRRKEMKDRLMKLGSGVNDEKKAFEIMSDLESIRPEPSVNNTNLLGQWDFVFNVEPDLGTGIIKEILQGQTPIQLVFDLDDLHLEISNEGGRKEHPIVVRVVVATKIFRQKANLVMTTSIMVDESDPYGTMFVEKFEGISLAGIKLPVPNSWKRSRPLEFSYVDDTMLIARGNGGEPHFLVRAKKGHRHDTI